MPPNHHINPRFRAYGKARIDVTRRAQSEAEFQQLWRPPANSFPFVFSSNEWKFCVEYKVDDFAAEVGFYIDILAFPVIAFSPSYAQFAAPGGDFCISVAALRDGEKSTPAETIRLQFKVEEILKLAELLEMRGIIFEHKPASIQEGSGQAAGYFRTPHGVCVDLWGEIVRKPDIHDLLEEDDEDGADTDAIIQRLLNLPAKEGEVNEHENGESDNEFLDDAQSLKPEEDSEELERDPPQGSPESEGKHSASPESLVIPPSKPVRYPEKSSLSGRNTPGKPSWDLRGNGEPTYHTIEDDSEIPGEDDL